MIRNNCEGEINVKINCKVMKFGSEAGKIIREIAEEKIE